MGHVLPGVRGFSCNSAHLLLAGERPQEGPLFLLSPDSMQLFFFFKDEAAHPTLALPRFLSQTPTVYALIHLFTHLCLLFF